MKTCKATIIQYNKDGEVTFEKSISVDVSESNAKKVGPEVGEVLAKTAFAFFNINEHLREMGTRMEGFSKTRPMYFRFEVSGQTLISETTLQELGIKLRLNKDKITEGSLAASLTMLMDAVPNPDTLFSFQREAIAKKEEKAKAKAKAEREAKKVEAEAPVEAG